MIQHIYTYYWFLQRVFFYFSNSWFDRSNICFFAFYLYVFSWWNVNINDAINVWLKFVNFQNESLRRHKWKNSKIFWRVNSSQNNQSFVVFLLIFMRFIFKFFLFHYLFICVVVLMAVNESVFHVLRFYARRRHFFHIWKPVSLFFKHASRIVLNDIILHEFYKLIAKHDVYYVHIQILNVNKIKRFFNILTCSFVFLNYANSVYYKNL